MGDSASRVRVGQRLGRGTRGYWVRGTSRYSVRKPEEGKSPSSPAGAGWKPLGLCAFCGQTGVALRRALGNSQDALFLDNKWQVFQ